MQFEELRRLETGGRLAGRPGRKEAIDVNIVVSRTVGILRSTLGDDIVLSVELDSQLKLIEADGAHLEQVVLNLAMNARDSMPDGGRLAIRTRMRPAVDNGVRETAGHDVCLDVSDTGCGLGTGLGLATVHGLVAENHGVIALDSVVGRGTTFSITFPATKANATPESVETPMFIEGCATILVVEDDPRIRALTEMVLRRAGHEVILAAGPQDALAAIRGPAAVNLVVTDVMMPGMNGYALASAMRTIRPGLKCVFMSGYADDRRAGQASDMFVAKPFTAEVLTLAVRRAIAA
jgi:two-component system, cell cycle sensor histidine kinase and response regulator CckA